MGFRTFVGEKYASLMLWQIWPVELVAKKLNHVAYMLNGIANC
jgi:hypothetical protein